MLVARGKSVSAFFFSRQCAPDRLLKCTVLRRLYCGGGLWCCYGVHPICVGGTQRMDEGGAAVWKQVTAMHYNALQKQVTLAELTTVL